MAYITIHSPGICDYASDEPTNVVQIYTRGLDVSVTIKVTRWFECERIGGLFGGYQGKGHLIPEEAPTPIGQLDISIPLGGIRCEGGLTKNQHQ